MEYDVVVAGAGPAGATAAYAAAKAGYRTALVEQQNLHRPKVCGGLITAPCAEIIRNTFGRDIAAEALVDPGILSVYLIPPTGIKDGLPQPNKKIYNVSRERFDGWLTDQAIAAGAVPYGNARLVGIKADGGRNVLYAQTPNGSAHLSSRFLVGADGVYSSVRRLIRPDFPNALGNIVQDYFEDERQFEPYFYVFLKKSVSPCYAYVVPKDGYTMLGTGRIPGIPPDIDLAMANLRAWLRQDFGFAGRSFAYREGWSVPFGSVCYGQDNVILIGDAGGFCHPFTAEGILYGAQAGSMVPGYVEQAEAQHRDLASVFQEEYEGVGQIMIGFRDHVLKLTDEDLTQMVQEKRAALVEAFAWDSSK